MIGDCLKTALTAIATNRLRSALTMLGIMIGVASVIVMVAIGAGARSEIERQITNLGTNTLTINSSAKVFGGRSSGPGTNSPMSEDDLKAIEKKVFGVVAVSGQLWAGATVVHGNANTFTRIWGVNEQYLALRHWPLEAGREITALDVMTGKRVAIIGRSVLKVLFGENDPVSQVIRIKNAPFTVIGVLSPKGKTSTGEDHDWNIFVPITTARAQIIGKNNGQVGQISVKFEDGVNLADAQEEIERVLRQSRRVPPGDDDTFTVGNLQSRRKPATPLKRHWAGCWAQLRPSLSWLAASAL